MIVAVFANDGQWEELADGLVSNNLIRIFSADEKADAYILLDGFNKEDIVKTKKPMLINSVSETLAILNAGSNVLRINGWNGFLQRKIWEVAGNFTDDIKTIFSILQKQYLPVADEPGLIAARSISMIINEAYFALGEAVSTKQEIDIAMKLGTNYPLGPFEWANKIGLKNIYALLDMLSKTDKRYLPAPLLKNEATA